MCLRELHRTGLVKLLLRGASLSSEQEDFIPPLPNNVHLTCCGGQECAPQEEGLQLCYHLLYSTNHEIMTLQSRAFNKLNVIQGPEFGEEKQVSVVVMWLFCQPHYLEITEAPLNLVLILMAFPPK